jgi:hypothetical protein
MIIEYIIFFAALMFSATLILSESNSVFEELNFQKQQTYLERNYSCFQQTRTK